MLNKSRVRLSPRLVAQTSPNPSRKPQRFFVASGVLLLAAAGFFAVRALSPKSPADNGHLPANEAILGAHDSEIGPANYYLYDVQPGDTLFSVSQRFQINWENIVDLNGLGEPFSLTAGQRLKLPMNAATKQQQFYDNLKKKIYVVEDGDNFVNVAQRLNVSVTDLLRANPDLASPDYLKPGQILQLP